MKRTLQRLALLSTSLIVSLTSVTVKGQDELMRAVQIQEFGGPEVLQVSTIPVPTPGPGELLVKVHAAAINPVDTSIRTGRAGGLSGAQLPYVPGFDVSGEVAAYGPDVTRFRVGDPVFAMLSLRRGGAYAEYAIVKESEAALKPESATHAEAASMPLVALTAWQALFDTAIWRRARPY